MSGRLGYEELVRVLKRSVAEGAADTGAVDRALAEAMRDGLLPADLVQILTNVLSIEPPKAPSAGQTAEAAEEELDDLFDEATVPHAVQPPGARDMAASASSGIPPPLPPQTDPSGTPAAEKVGKEIRDRVDDAVLSSFIGEFRAMREPRGARPEAARTDALDGLLSGYKSARFRSNARRAVHRGASEGASLGELGDLGRRRAGLGSILRDRFILDAEIGRGGMGIVYSAVDRRRLEAGSVQPYVALKLLNDTFRGNSEALRVLESEARKAQSLAHPNIATVHDFDRDKSEIFIVMELLSGKPLSRHLAAAMGQGMPGQRITTILKGICAGLAYAHERGVVHSDLKPANVFVTDEDTVKLLDFGLATAGTAGGFDASALNALTAPYASPEMFEGAPRDPRDDIFALGCIAYQLLMGNHPFAMKPTAEAAEEGMVPEPIPDLDPPAWNAIATALSFDRETRTPSVKAFFEGLFED